MRRRRRRVLGMNKCIVNKSWCHRRFCCWCCWWWRFCWDADDDDAAAPHSLSLSFSPSSFLIHSHQVWVVAVCLGISPRHPLSFGYWFPENAGNEDALATVPASRLFISPSSDHALFLSAPFVSTLSNPELLSFSRHWVMFGNFWGAGGDRSWHHFYWYYQWLRLIWESELFVTLTHQKVIHYGTTGQDSYKSVH